MKNKNELVLYFVRHGETMLNALDRVQGWIDSPLTSEGEKVIESLGIGLKEVAFERAYTSTSRRTIETANIIIKRNSKKNISIRHIKNLREWYFGGFEGDYNSTMGEAVMGKAGIKSQDELIDLGVDKVADIISEEDPLGQAENWKKIDKRVKEALAQIVNENSKKGGNILIISHGLTIATIVYIVSKGKAPDLMNGSVSKISYLNGKFKVLGINDMSAVYAGGYLKPFELIKEEKK